MIPEQRTPAKDFSTEPKQGTPTEDPSREPQPRTQTKAPAKEPRIRLVEDPGIVLQQRIPAEDPSQKAQAEDSAKGPQHKTLNHKSSSVSVTTYCSWSSLRTQDKRSTDESL